MSILKAITISMGWLAGSLASISAVLGCCGFIVVRSHSNLLGLGDFLQYSNHFYIIEGAEFLLYTIIVMNETVLRIGILLFLIIIIPFVIFNNSKVLVTSRARLKDSIGSIVNKRGWLFRLLAGIILLGLFFFRLVPYLDDFKKPMVINDLLVTAITEKKSLDSCEAETFSSDCITKRIVQGERVLLEGYYFSLLLHYLEAALILLVAWRFSVNWQYKTIVRLSFAAMFLTFTLMMPMCYGVLVKPAELSTLTLNLKDNSAALPASNLFILQKSDKAFIAWNYKQRKIVWYPASNVASASIGKRQKLFQPLLKTKEGSL